MGPVIGWTLIAVGTAGLVILLAFINRPSVREYLGPFAPVAETVPFTVADAAVETPEAGAAHPPASPASGTTSTFDQDVDEALAIVRSVRDDPIVAWCGPCGGFVGFQEPDQVVNHVMAHAFADDWAQWEQEVSP